MTLMNESRIPIILEFEEGPVLEGYIDRVLGPLIIEEIKSKFPIEGRAAYLRGELKITLGIGKGNLKPTKNVKKGDIAYMPLGDSLCIYLHDMTTFSQVNVIGRITSGDEELARLATIRRGSQVHIKSSS